MKLFAYAILLVFTMSGLDKCEKAMEGESVDLGQTFDLELEKTAVVKSEKIGITFLKKTDNRCPKDVNCIQAGESVATLQITGADGTSEEIMLKAKGMCYKQEGSCGETKSAIGYDIKLMNVNPYPGTEAANNGEATTVKIMVSKK